MMHFHEEVDMSSPHPATVHLCLCEVPDGAEGRVGIVVLDEGIALLGVATVRHHAHVHDPAHRLQQEALMSTAPHSLRKAHQASCRTLGEELTEKTDRNRSSVVP